MSVQSLRDELLAVAGVAEVELDGDGTAPAGVRIRLATEADPEAVGLEVQKVLAAHGMRSRLDSGSMPPPPPVLPVVAPTPTATAEEDEAEEPPAPAAPHPEARLKAVRLEESAVGLEVTVLAADGREATRRAAASEDGLAAAAIEAVGLLLLGEVPRVIAVDWATANGSQVVTVVLESPEGARGAGAGLVRASRAYAVARAAWAALTP